MAHTLDVHADALHRGPASGGATRGHARGSLDFARIGAEAGAIAINLAALLLLLAPLTPPPLPLAEPDQIIFVPQTPRRPPELPPRPVEVVRPHPTPPRAPVIAPPRIEVMPPPSLDALPGDVAVEPEPLADAGLDRLPTVSEPLPGVRLEYLAAPPPPYPRDALRDGLTGTVLLRVLVGIDGRPLRADIERSSGHRALDAAARRQVLAKWRFKPAMQDGHAIQAIGLVPIDFTLAR